MLTIDTLSLRQKELFIKDHKFTVYDKSGNAILYQCENCNIQIIIQGYLLSVLQGPKNYIYKGCLPMQEIVKADTLYNLLNNYTYKQRYNYLILSCPERIIKYIIE